MKSIYVDILQGKKNFQDDPYFDSSAFFFYKTALKLSESEEKVNWTTAMVTQHCAEFEGIYFHDFVSEKFLDIMLLGYCLL